MIFKNEKQLRTFLMDKSKGALAKAQEEVYKIIESFLMSFYADYDPSIYERTYQLLSSLVKSDIRLSSKGWIAYVYFDLDSINYVTGGRPTPEQVMDAANRGLHGAMGAISNSGKEFLYVGGSTGVNVWDDPMSVLSVEAINILVEKLKAQGIPIKKA